MAANPLLQVLLGPNHEQVQARLRDRAQRRKANRAQRRAATPSRTAGGMAPSWPGQISPVQQNGLRPPPPPGGPSGPAAEQLLAEPVDTSAATEPGPAPQPQSEQPSAADEPWMPVSGLPPEPWWVRIRRGLVVVVALVVTVAGVTSISSTVARWVHPPAPPAAAPAVTDVQLSGFAETAATDYLSWDGTDKSSRQAALARYAAPGSQIDGWGGTGRQTAETASTVDLRRGPGAESIATVRVRVTPYAGGGPSPPAAAGPAPGAGAAAAPTVPQSGTPQPARWITLAVPVSATDGRLAVTAKPAPVGSPPEAVYTPAVPGNTAGDDAFAKTTQPTVSRLLDAYASGDLSYARASGTHFAGLSGDARLADLDQWRVRPLSPGADPTHRVGDATVTWQLAGGGQISSSYRVQLQQNDGRWYLAGLTTETQEVSH